MVNRRKLLGSFATVSAMPIAWPALSAGEQSRVDRSGLRGSIDAVDYLRPSSYDDQTRAFNRMLKQSSDSDVPVFLPAGVYVVSNLILPARVRISGVPGATRIIYGGDGHLMLADGTERVDLQGLVIDGQNRWLNDDIQGIVDLRGVSRVAIDNCEIVGSGKNGVALERSGGRIERCTISGSGDAGIYSVDGAGLAIRDNQVADCANGGIVVHRWQPGNDGTQISGNRVQRIAARSGGTGQYGNGINVFRANGVIVSGNSVTDCAFSSVRANSSSNLQISGNTCERSGETSIYAEFAFEGAVISNNIVDGAANGISIVNFNEGGRMGACSGNIVRNLSSSGPYKADPPGFGVGITVEADCSVTGNIVENAPLYGMHIGWGAFMRNVVATGNVVRQAPTGVAVSVVKGTGSAVISDNLFDGTPQGAVVGYEWTKPATSDLASEGSQKIANLLVERNRLVQG